MNLVKLIKQDIRNLFTNPVVIIFGFVYPMVLIVLFGYLFSSFYGGGGVTAYDYYGITMIIFLVLSSCTITPNAFMERKIKNSNLRVLFSPTNNWEIYGSKIISTFLFIGSLFTLDMSILSITGMVNYGGGKFLYILILILVLLFFTVTLGAFVCVLIKNEEGTNKILSLVCNILALTSGIFFPIDGLGEKIKSIVALSPIKMIIESIFKIIYDGNFNGYLTTISIIISITIILLIGINFLFNGEDYI
ncbi:ABC transporter permease [Clostridium sp. Marseille-Q7071]